MKAAVISTYPPRQCGIATFSDNLIKSIYTSKNDLTNVKVIAINDELTNYQYPEEVKFIIKQQNLTDYVRAAKFINLSDCDLCIIQHEFGIFGGESGIYILSLIHHLEVPLIVTLHSVLKEPDFIQRSIFNQMATRARKMVVMSQLAVKFLEDIYKVPPHKISLIEHGVPDLLDHLANKENRRQNGKNVRRTLLTFGLLSRNKGIETVIRALPRVVNKHPDLLYVILGNTHPNVVKESGEAYRNFLHLLIRENKLEKHVQFIKKFVPENDLIKHLLSAEIYITPYLNEAQTTSGTLVYAIGAGTAVISTPYWHASEILCNDRGRLFNFKDHVELADVLIDLLDHPEKLCRIRENAFSYGRNLRWSIIGKRYKDLSGEVIKSAAKHPVKTTESIINLNLIPDLNLDHMRRITDDTGIIQHAKYGIPNLKEGYCLDDNSRALLASLMIYRITKDRSALDLLPIYFSYIHYMQNIKGTFRNFMSFNRQFLDEEGSEDAFGRTIWSLGYLIHNTPNDAYYQLAEEIFQRAKENFNKLESTRGIANTIIGISYYLYRLQTHEEMINILNLLTNKLIEKYRVHHDRNWEWFEDIMTYDNGILPLALFHSGEITGEHNVQRIAERTTRFLIEVTMNKGHLTPVGSDGWYPRNGTCAHFAQQATDVMAMVLLLHKAFTVTRKIEYLGKMFQAFTWFLGENDLRIPLYDHETHGCCDGLESFGVNRNQGAESTLAYIISHLTVLQAKVHEHEAKKQSKKAKESEEIS